MYPRQGYGYVLGGDGKVHEGSYHIYGGGFSAALDMDNHPHPEYPDYPIAAMRPIIHPPEVELFRRMGRFCELCFDSEEDNG